jgi:acyl-coenzyme A synthetase/AMP-(fatty) acid ligase
VRLSGEIADQAILGRLGSTFPHAKIAHAFASTEAGVAFDVTDGQEGFPASVVDMNSGPVTLKVQNGSLHVKSNRTASVYLGTGGKRIPDEDGFIDTADLVERRGERYYFVGRRDGTINIGGLKVSPEEVEAVVSSHPTVRIARARARKNPIVGSIIAVDVVADIPTEGDDGARDAIKNEILELCQKNLPRHKIPAAIKFVSSIELNESGKVAR